MIFRKSYDTGEIPNSWKVANVTQVFKKGSKCNPSNYCRIPLTCIACKLMEHIITSSVMHGANDNHIHYPLQHGFLTHYSMVSEANVPVRHGYSASPEIL